MTFIFDFCIRVPAYPQPNPSVLKQIDIDNYQPLFRSFTCALNSYEAFREPLLNAHQVDIMGELTEYLDLKFNWSHMAHAHLAYPKLAPDNCCGTDLGQDAESFIRPTEQKIHFSLSDAAGDADELANFTFRKKTLFFFTLRTSY